MSDKKRQLLERAAATRRLPEPNRLLEPQDRKPGYRIVPVSL